MSSIDLTNIDPTFPIAGQDNDSQGFRDNVFNTKAALENAKAEIEALETLTTVRTTAPLTSAGIGGNNPDRAGMVAVEAGYIYICFADFDGIEPIIWVRTAIDGGW